MLIKVELKDLIDSIKKNDLKYIGDVGGFLK